MTSPPIDITGIGCISALGTTFRQNMGNLYRGFSRPGRPSRFSIDQPEDYPVFEVDDTQVKWPRVDRDYNRTTLLALAAAEEALEQAELSRQILRRKRVGVCIGTTVGNSLNNESFYAAVQAGETPDLREIKRYLHSNPAEVIAHELNICGPILTVANACSSGTDALGTAKSWLNNDLCDIVIAGGAEELSRISYIGFISLMIHATEMCKPFDAHRSGLNLGEGAAIMICEKDGRQRTKSSITGFGMGSDAYHLTAPHPKGLGLKLAIEQAMKDAEISFVSAINAHGTGTLDNDRVEMTVFDQLFSGVPYFSVKGYTGHTLGAAGAIEAAISIGCLKRGRLPASAGFSTADANHRSHPLTENTAFSGSALLSQSLAFGGNNSVIILER